MDNAFNTQTAVLDASTDEPSANIAARISAVPEPVGFGALAALGAGVLGRRRRSPIGRR